MGETPKALQLGGGGWIPTLFGRRLSEGQGWRGALMALPFPVMSTRFQKLVQEAKLRIREISPEDASKEIENGAMLIDVREQEEWEAGHIPGAVHLSRGIIELEIEEQVPDLDRPIICHCGGGGRSALVAESLQKMGYKNVKSLAGGFKGWKQANLPVTQ